MGGHVAAEKIAGYFLEQDLEQRSLYILPYIEKILTYVTLGAKKDPPYDEVELMLIAFNYLDSCLLRRGKASAEPGMEEQQEMFAEQQKQRRLWKEKEAE